MTEGPPRRHRTAEPLTRVWIPDESPRRRRKRRLARWLVPLGYLGIAAVTAYLAWPWGGGDGPRREVVRTITRTTETGTGGVKGVTFRRGSPAGPRLQGTLTTRLGPLLPLPAGGLARFDGRYVTASDVQVLEVVGDEAFWIGSSARQRVLVHLQDRGARESPIDVRAGMRVSFRGTVAPNPPGAAVAYGLTLGEGALFLERQGRHIAVNPSKLTVR